MSITIVEVGPSTFSDYGAIPSVLTVREVLDIIASPGGAREARLTRRTLDRPYLKNYDDPPALPPSQWAEHFDLGQWGFFTAKLAGEDVGRAAIAWRTSGVDLLENRSDLAVLWDIRVAPKVRRQGIGAALFRAAEEWAVSRCARILKVETQNVNVPACAFYEDQGCVLGAINRDVYPELPDEVQMLWYKNLADERSAV